MDILRQFLASKANNIRVLVQKNGTPSEEQLSSYVTTLSQQLFGQVVAQAPAEIQTICEEGVRRMGWNKQAKTKLSGSAFSVESVLAGLAFIENAINALTPSTTPTAEELANLSDACKKLWQLDVNRLVPGVDYVINLQEGKRVYDKGDFADDPLFTFVDERVFSKPTFRAFVALLDNYVAETGVTEVVSDAERRENSEFIRSIMATPLMQYCHNYLVAVGKAPSDVSAFSRLLSELWFGLYKRETANDSSGFEHVFLGEIKDGAVTGMHNWVHIYLEEKKKNFNYLGFITPKRVPGVSGYHLPEADQQLITIQFEWKGCLKNVSSSFVGTSPEFEIALYTLCFFVGNDEKDIVDCGPYHVEVTCFKYNSRGKTYIGTSFPAEAPLH